jgi:Beta-lactamase superfamily domain
MIPSRTVAATLATWAMISLAGAQTAPAPSEPAAPKDVRMTWFGISNYHYQIGDVGVLIDGAVSLRPVLGKQTTNEQLVDKVHEALTKRGTINVMLVGHHHFDHSLDTPYWAKKNGAKVYAPAEACMEAAAGGVPVEQCVPIHGGEVIKLSPHVTVRVVRWNHSISSGCKLTANQDFKTYGFLFTVQTPEKQLAWYMSDSGAGSELLKEYVDDGVNRGAPAVNLMKAVRDAGLRGFDIWQGGPETRVVSQARIVIPQFQPKYVMPHHFGFRGGYDFLGGLHYSYKSGPKLEELLRSFNIPQVVPDNYLDAWVYDKDGLRPVENADAKAVVGLPSSGPGPKPQGVNPRQDEMECPGD